MNTTTNPGVTPADIEASILYETWSKRIEAAALFQPVNTVTLHHLCALEDEIRAEANATHRGETREHVEAIALVCAFKLQIMRVIEDEREEARELACRECALREDRVRYPSSMAERERLYEARNRGFHV